MKRGNFSMSGECVLLTGASGFIGRRLLQKLSEEEREIHVLVRTRSLPRMRRLIQRMGDAPGRIRLVEGDVMRRGLFEDEAVGRDLSGRLTHVVHLAAVYDLTMPRALGMAVNVGGTENVLNFCEGVKRLDRFAYGSTVAVSGRHPGIFREDDLDIGQAFRNFYDETKFLAERLVRRRMDRIPTVIYRPTIVVGDSRTGEADKVDGPYYAFRAIRKWMHLMMPETGLTKCHAVPVDFVVNAMVHLLKKDGAPGRTYCIGDPNPMTYSEFVDAVCEIWERPKPLLKLPARMIEIPFGLPGVARLTGIPKQSFAYTYIPVEYTFDNFLAALDGSGLSCPPAREYLPVLVDYFERYLG